ncbi:hypothetical protein HBA54_21740 [Pelagibius litoralis]|uniref:Uncharacterized protein n=1 Tax=Pelagibius litoralis TaxID=374515 RepID=A0A967F1H7_9PROT|nr:hypothetical protein [Pelagibius litoralis]NIA71226.1 hypothetical protein [Pelagibius litoralis]
MLFETGAGRFQPDPDYNYASDQRYVLDQQFLAFVVGSVALGLPIAMLIGVVTGTCFYDSISHFYYSKLFGDVLVSALVFIGTFLVAYRGESRRESRLATFAGFSAFGIALFPTTGRGCEELDFSGRILADLKAASASDAVSVSPAEDFGQFFQLFPYADALHFTSAALLFSFLAFYTFFVFTRVIEDEHVTEDGELTPVKKARNRLYISSGVVIVVAMLAMAANALNSAITDMPWAWWTEYNATFWVEAAALWAFGVSWMVKGRLFGLVFLDPRDRPRQ